MRPAANSLHTRLTEAADDLTGILDRLEAAVPYRPSRPASPGGVPRGGHGPLASWYSSAAYLIMEVHQGLRETEQNIRYRLSGRLRERGGSDGNTRKILEDLPGLLAGADYAAGNATARQLENWAQRGRTVLGETEPFTRLPRLPGEPDPACPYCGRGTLRYRPYSGAVRCINPVCRDSAGNRPAGQIEPGAYSREPLLAWSDGTTGTAARVE
jgi:hypothetical protein